MQVATIIEKLPKPWKEFQKTLSHKQSELKLMNLISRLQISKEIRKQDKGSNHENVNLVSAHNDLRKNNANLKPK